MAFETFEQIGIEQDRAAVALGSGGGGGGTGWVHGHRRSPGRPTVRSGAVRKDRGNWYHRQPS